MKKLIVLISCLFVLCSCATGLVYNPVLPEGSYHDENVAFAVEAMEGKSGIYLDLVFQNNSSEMVYLDLDKSGLSTDGYTQRVVNGNTRVIDSNRTQVAVPVNPGSYAHVSLFHPDADGFLLNSTSNLTISYVLGSESKYASMKFLDDDKSNYLGSVELSDTNWNWFFVGGPEKVYDKLKEKAVAMYGSDIEVVNIVYDKKWSPMSLLLYFDLFGYVENFEATADVYRK